MAMLNDFKRHQTFLMALDIECSLKDRYRENGSCHGHGDKVSWYKCPPPLMLKNITGNIQKEQAIIPVLLTVLQSCQKYTHLLTDITGRTALPHVLNTKYCVKTNTTYTHKNTAVTIAPCTGKVQTRHIYQNLYINYYAVIISLWAQINFSTNIWLRNHWNRQPNSNQFSTLTFQLQTWIILGWIVIEKLIFGWSLFQNQRFLNQISTLRMVEQSWGCQRLNVESMLIQRWEVDRLCPLGSHLGKLPGKHGGKRCSLLWQKTSKF